MRLSFHTLLLLATALFSLQAVAFQGTYKLGAGDKIQISVYGEDDLSIDELYINNSGSFDYPYLGQLEAIGKTPEQLKQEIYIGLKGDYLISPKVRVSVVGFRSIYVNGEVKKPGGYEYQPGLTVDKAIALAGGFTDRAARNKVFVSKAGDDETKNKAKLSSSVLPGDIIVIEQSFF
ncbi:MULTISPECIES: polysaccharide biosynthesis/export family protein [Vibrio]|uniref:Capsular biosynthesis protein n=1 Tax=Vibrio bivalvicida TaxID=1276888 RepID=A0A177Y303_9VIBR|nr:MULTISPECIES: polysaccharide biosynthesis/export family protein [Vibrio]KLN63529.1 capsular biosynthesis protein [Vibrio sp. VPAP30]OAJ95263.1 capsular biosynthesis protein [Vibrio bivalvicida]